MGLQGGEWGSDGTAGGMGDRGRGRGGFVPRGRFGGFGGRFEGSGGRSEGGRFEGTFRGRGVPMRGRGGRSGDEHLHLLAKSPSMVSAKLSSYLTAKQHLLQNLQWSERHACGNSI